jgi:hypothetical protein
MSDMPAPTPDSLEQGALTIVAMLTALHNGLPYHTIWGELDPGERSAVAFTMLGALHAATCERAAMFGIPVDTVLLALGESAIEGAEALRQAGQ